MRNFLSQPFYNKEELFNYLENTNNSYTIFIRKKLAEASTTIQPTSPLETSNQKLIYEKHHIQPLHANGLDEPWNIIQLSYEDHTTAHRLLFECYNSLYDKSAWNMRQGLTSNGRKAISRANVEKARTNKTGRFSSELQSKIGSLPKKPRKPFAKKPFIISALKKGMIWVNTEDGTRYTIEGETMESVLDVATLLSEKMRNAFENKKSQSYLYTGITKLLEGWIDPVTKKSLFSVGPWRLEGLLI